MGTSLSTGTIQSMCRGECFVKDKKESCNFEPGNGTARVLILGNSYAGIVVNYLHPWLKPIAKEIRLFAHHGKLSMLFINVDENIQKDAEFSSISHALPSPQRGRRL